MGTKGILVTVASLAFPRTTSLTGVPALAYALSTYLQVGEKKGSPRAQSWVSHGH